MLESTNLQFTADDLLWVLVAAEKYLSICKKTGNKACKEIIDSHAKMDKIWYNLPENTQLEIFKEI